MYKCDGLIVISDMKKIFNDMISYQDASNAEIALGFLIEQLIESSRDVLNMDRKHFMESVNYEYNYIEWRIKNGSKETKKSINRI